MNNNTLINADIQDTTLPEIEVNPTSSGQIIVEIGTKCIVLSSYDQLYELGQELIELAENGWTNRNVRRWRENNER